jgi:FkbM family methyltransferase
MNKSLEIIQTKQFGNFIIDEYDLIGGFIKHHGFWEHHLYGLYSSLIKKDYYCIDAGANLGFHSIQLGNLSKKVYAFEPQSYIYNQLCANILFNDLDNVIETYKLGLGNKEDTKQLWNIEHENWVGNGAHNWGGRGVIQENYGGERATHNEFREEDTIKIVPLDSLNIPRCDLIKIDVQGYEYNLLIGAKNLLNKFKPTIFLENPPEEESSAIVKNHLVSLGYEFYRLTAKSLPAVGDLKINNNLEDCVLIHPDHKDYKDHLNVINTLTSKYGIVKE